MTGKRLRLARVAAGLSLRALAGRIGNRVTAQAIGKYERDESMPSSGVLLSLADALGVSADYLLGDTTGMIPETVAFGKKIASKRETARLEAGILHLLERYLGVEEMLGLGGNSWHRWHRSHKDVYPVIRDVAEADDAARRLRKHWGLGTDPIPNLVELLEERGIKVFCVDLKNMDGMTARVGRACAPKPTDGAVTVRGDKDMVAVLVVNSKEPGERQRFTLARELGHIVLGVSDEVDKEAVARRFAGAFLMPADALRAEVGRHRTLIGGRELFYLKELFGVSAQEIAQRCRDLGIFGESLFRQLMREFNRLGWCNPPYREPYAMCGEVPARLQRLILRGLAEGVISEAKAAELFGLSVRELNQGMQMAIADEVEKMAVAA